jgi:hypothetical protein
MQSGLPNKSNAGPAGIAAMAEAVREDCSKSTRAATITAIPLLRFLTAFNAFS